MFDYQFIFSGLTSHGVSEKLCSIVKDTLCEKYGSNPDELIVKRIREEWGAMERSNTVLDVAALYELVTWLKKNDHPYRLRGCAGSGFILHLLGITLGNPLPPHYHCPKCHAIKWSNECLDGFDLPRRKSCEQDGAILIPDGHDIPWQTLWGYGEHIPLLDICLPKSLHDDLTAVLKKHWLNGIGSANKFSQEDDPQNLRVSLSNLRFIFSLDCATIHKTFHCKKVDASSVREALQAWQTLLNYTDSYNVQSVLGVYSFADLIYFSGIINSNGTWDEEAVFMNQHLDYAPSELIAFRDDIYQYLISHNFLEKDAWKGMTRVRKGLDLPVITEEMKHSRDKWVLDRCNKINYLVPKANFVEYILFRLKADILPEKTHRMYVDYDVIDYGLGGIDQSDVVLIGGRVAMGKTAFALDIAVNLACTFNKKVAIFAATDNEENISAGLERRANTKMLANLSVYTENTLSVELMRNKLNGHNADLVVVDCLQSFSSTARRSAAHIEAIMREIKQLAKDLNVPVLLLTQLSRNVERRKNHIPLAKDIPYFESVDPFADSILLLYRDAYYNSNANRSSAWCIIEKNVRGDQDAIPLIWNEEKLGFENAADL